MPWVSPGCWMKSNLAIMYKQTTQSALTEEVSKNNDPTRPKAKQIFLGIDAHLASPLGQHSLVDWVRSLASTMLV